MHGSRLIGALVACVALSVALLGGCSSDRRPTLVPVSCGQISMPGADNKTAMTKATECMRNAWDSQRLASFDIYGASVEGDRFRVTYRLDANRRLHYLNTPLGGPNGLPSEPTRELCVTVDWLPTTCH